MPFEGNHANDIGLETPDGSVCKFDSKSGQIKSSEEIFKGGVEFFLRTVAGGDRNLAERLTRTNMRHLPYWQVRPFAELDGAQATPEEFQAAMAKI